MKETAKVTLYEINKCGLYKLKKDNTPVFGDLGDLLNQFHTWAKQDGMLLANTCTYAPIGTDDSYKTYCYDIIVDKDLVLLTTWNETPKTSGNKLLSVSGTATVGNATINTASIKKGDIPGYAAYFIFFTNENKMATINFDHSLNGRLNLEKLFTEFISKNCSYANSRIEQDIDGDDIEIIEYKANPEDEPQFLTAYFETKLVRNKTNIEYLITNYDLIRKIHKHNEIPFFKFESRAYWQKIPGIYNKKDDELTAKYSLEFRYTPNSEEEIRTIINDWQENHKETKWEDLGFTLIGKSSPIWLSGTIARNDFELDIRRNKNEIVEPIDLLTQLKKISTQILNLKST